MLCRDMCRFALVIAAGYSMAAAAESYRFESHLSDAKQVTVTPVDAGVGSRSLFSAEGPLAWLPSGSSASSQVQVEGDSLVLVAKEPDRLCSPPNLNLDMSGYGCLELELRVDGQDSVRIMRGFLWDQQPCIVAVPQQGQFFTARIDPRLQRGWMFPATSQIMIGVDGAARLEIHAVRAVPPLLVAPVGTRMHKVGDSARQTLFAHCPTALEYTLRVPPRGFFSAGLCVASNSQPVTFRVDVRRGDSMTAALTRTVDAAGKWTDVEADLSAFAGQDATITLSASCDTAGQVALWGDPAVLERRAPGERTPPNILYYVVDALRADHLDAYGYPRKTAPELTAYAGNGVRFDWCLSQATWTTTSVPSCHAGVGPSVHKIDLLLGDSVPSSLVTFPELLRDAGYTTGAVSENDLVPPETGPRCSYGTVACKTVSVGATTTERATRFLEANRDRPFLLYVHTMECNAVPGSAETRYEAPAPFHGMFSAGTAPSLMDDYDDCIAHADRNFGDVLKKLSELGLADNTLVIFSADHGEAFREHDNLKEHGGAPYAELIRVPLVVSWPGVLPAGKVFDETVCLLDMAPTLLDYAGVPVPAQFQGGSLRGLIEGTGAGPFQERTVFSQGRGSSWPRVCDLVVCSTLASLMPVNPKLARGLQDGYFDEVFSAVKAPWALICQYPNGPKRLYNLAVDPAEAEDVAVQHPQIVNAMKVQIDAHRIHEAELSAQLGKSTAEKRDAFDNAQKEELQSLGYLRK